VFASNKNLHLGVSKAEAYPRIDIFSQVGSKALARKKLLGVRFIGDKHASLFLTIHNAEK
jgi:hypothetical protein